MKEIIYYFQNLPEPLIYLFLFFSNFIENVFPPWPADVINVLSGFLSAQDVISLPVSFLAITVGNTAGAVLMFFAGTKIIILLKHIHLRSRDTLFARMFDFLSEDGLERTASHFKKSEFLFVLFSRFFAGIRFFASITAGLAKMNFGLFFTAFFIGACAWTAILLIAGYYLGDKWERFLEWLKIYNIIFFTLLGILIAVVVIIKRKKKD